MGCSIAWTLKNLLGEMFSVDSTITSYTKAEQYNMYITVLHISVNTYV